MRPFLLYLTFALLLASVSAGYAAVIKRDAPSPPTASAAAKKHKSRVQIKANFDDLYPGGEDWTWLRVRNRSPWTVRVRKIQIRALDAGPYCLRDNLITPTLRVKKKLRPRRKMWVWAGVRLAPDAADGCQDAVFPLKFRAKVRP